jgi:hypothetical protein
VIIVTENGSQALAHLGVFVGEWILEAASRGIEVFSRRSVARGGREWTSADLQPDAGLRLYRATASI